MKKIIVFILILFSTACDKTEEKKEVKRWYSDVQVNLGSNVYGNNCQSCHGNNGTGAPNWQKKLADGSNPPPPLNETAHAWHHSFEDTLKVINEGAGNMPAFAEKLSAEEKTAVIAYIHSLWPDKTYRKWSEDFGK